MADDPTPAGARAVETLCNALVTATIVSLVTRHGAERAREYVFRHFRRQQRTKFLPGLEKLGLAHEPPAVACALYHYHANALGGVRTEVVCESARKAWVRYPPPRWMWRGTAIAAIPHDVSAAMLHGWHGNNGVMLGRPELGFVCTGMTVDGDPGLEGYYLQHDRPLAPQERVRFARGEETMPRFDPASVPALGSAAWPAARRARARCRYAVDYVRTLLAELEALLGPESARAELGRVARLVGLQFLDEAMDGAGHGGAPAFARWMTGALAAQGEAVEWREDGAAQRIALRGWALAKGLGLADEDAAFAAWNELWVGAALAHDRFLRVEATRAGWTIS